MRTVRELALEIVLSESLEAKLLMASELVDEDRGGGTKIVAPGRPRDLVFSRERTPMPRPPALHDPEKRAICLHRFANHELQAIEIMAWALLAFPDAPAGFRAGLLATLAEEQLHLGLYLDRLRALGRHFGELPVNDYFWGKVQDLASPLHYLAAMGLTFEVGNLDHTLTYRDAFRRGGDPESASILDRIHRDEIGHVHFAVTWLRRLKDPRLSDWDAYTAHLRFPLGPHRARGAEFRAEPRLAAGLEPGFVRALERARPA
jgi:uncharacterized ferritin-like protein (DUF455 family)